MARGKRTRITREGKQIVLSHSTPSEPIKDGKRVPLSLVHPSSGKVTGQLFKVTDLKALLLFEVHYFHIVSIKQRPCLIVDFGHQVKVKVVGKQLKFTRKKKCLIFSEVSLTWEGKG